MMRAETKRFLKRATMAASGKRGINYGTLLLLAFIAAFLSVLMLQKLRERRVLSLLVQEQQQQLLTLQLHLQTEREQSKEMRSGLEELRDKTISLVNQKTELSSKLMETKIIITNLETRQTEMTAALEEKEKQINGMKEKAASPDMNLDHQITTLIQLLNQKEAEIDEMKRQLRLVEDNPAEKSSAVNGEEKSRDGSEETSEYNDNGDPSKERQVRNADEVAIERENSPKARKWVQIEEQDEEDDSKDQSMTDNEKLDISNKSQPEEEQTTETKERKDIENAELTDDTADNKTARREEEETQANNDGEIEKPYDSLGKTAIKEEEEEAQGNKDEESEEPDSLPSRIDVNITEETDGAKVEFRQVEKSAELISYSDDTRILKSSRQPEMPETSRRSKFLQEGGKDEQQEIDSEEEKGVKNVEHISRTDDSQSTKVEANERKFTRDGDSEKLHYPTLAYKGKESSDARYGERTTDRASPRARLARRIRRRSIRRPHLLKAETSQGDERGMNRRNTRSSKVEIDNNKRAATTGRNLPQTADRIITLRNKTISETARIINKRAKD